MGDPKSEADTHGVEENKKRMDFASSAINWVRERIEKEKSLTPELARELGILYIAYSWQLWSFAEDHLDATGDREFLDDVAGKYTLEDREIRVHRLRGFEKILFDAQHGEYESMKIFFQTSSNESLENMGEVILRRALPAKLPPPAWMDPRFNPDANPLPTDLQEIASDK